MNWCLSSLWPYTERRCPCIFPLLLNHVGMLMGGCGNGKGRVGALWEEMWLSRSHTCGLVNRVTEAKIKIMLTKVRLVENASQIQLPAVWLHSYLQFLTSMLFVKEKSFSLICWCLWFILSSLVKSLTSSLTSGKHGY